MNRAPWIALLLLAPLAGCQLPPEEKIPLQPLPETGQPVLFADVVQRARLQATAALEAFYLDKWGDLADLAAKIEQAARLLPRSTAVPPRHKDRLQQHADELTREAVALQEAAKNQDVPRTNQALQRIHLKVRELRPEG
jgi:hypothetical protein